MAGATSGNGLELLHTKVLWRFVLNPKSGSPLSKF